MVEWFALHPSLTVLLILVLTSGLWLGPVLVILTMAAAGIAVVAGGILCLVAGIWEWVEIWVRRLRRR